MYEISTFQYIHTYIHIHLQLIKTRGATERLYKGLHISIHQEQGLGIKS